MDYIKSNLLLIIMAVVLLSFGGPVFAQATGNDADTGFALPDLEVSIVDFSGDVSIKRDTETMWTAVEEGMQLKQNDSLKTDRSSTATLKIPGLALVNVGESAQFQLTELQRSQESKGLFVNQEKVSVNDINLEVSKGNVENSLKQREGVETNYELETPNAVAGIRGTTFECDVSTGRTECTVLEGSVSFSSRAQGAEEVELGALEQSSVSGNDTQPSEPETVEEDQVENLKQVQEKAEKATALPPVLSSLSLNGNQLDQSGEGSYSAEISDTNVRTLTLSGQAQAPAEGASIIAVNINRGEEKIIPDGKSQWEASLELEEPSEGSKTVNATIIVYDSNGNQSRAHPLTVDVTADTTVSGDTDVSGDTGVSGDTDVSGDTAVSGDTLIQEKSDISRGQNLVGNPQNFPQGNFGVGMTSIAGIEAEDARFPLDLTGSQLSQSGSSDTDPNTSNGLKISGEIQTDSEVAGVSYRFEGQEEWQQISNSSSWNLRLPLKQVANRDEPSIEIIAWTSDGIRSRINKVGPFTYDVSEAAIPIGASSGNVSVDVSLESVGNQQLSSTDLPDSFTSDDVTGEGLVVRGTAQSDSPVAGVAYSLDGGNSWEDAQGTSNWSFTLPADNEQTFNVQVVAWIEGDQMGEPTTFGPILYRTQPEPTSTQQTETTQTDGIPTDYPEGDVSVNVNTIGGKDISNLEFPYHLFKGDGAQNGVLVRGGAQGSASIAGVAYSLDGGNSWERAEGAESWNFNLPTGGNWSHNPVVFAWTTDGVRSSEIEVGELEYESTNFSQTLRQKFREHWNHFSNNSTDKFIEDYADNFEYIDSRTGEDLTLNGFDNFISDFSADVSNLNVFYNINQVFASQSGGEVQFALEWRGTDDRANEPFVMFGRQSRYKYRRANNGEFDVINFEDFPLIEYLYHRQDAKNIGDLRGFELKSMDVVGEEDGDIFPITGISSFFVNKIKLGGEVQDGGFRNLGKKNFGSVQDIQELGSGYTDPQTFTEGDLLAVNIRGRFGEPTTSLLKVLDLRADFVSVRVISAITPPGIRPRAFRSYRGIDPYQ